VLDALLRAGHQVTALVRSAAAARALASREVQAVRGDIGKPPTYRVGAAGHDVFVHAAFSGGDRGPVDDALAVETILEAASNAEPATFIYTSGVWVIGSTHAPAAEDVSLQPAALVAWRPAVEQRVLTSNGPRLRTIVLRPGLVYGGSRGIISDMLTDADNGLMRVVGTGENHWPVVYDRDLAELYVRLIATPDASGIYHGTDDSDETVREIVDAIAEHTPSRPEVRFMPLEEARKKRGPMADALALDQRVRSPRARALGWTPTLGSITRNVPRLFEEWRNARHEEAEREH
jgi:nucleoside-diphosphate-sugar epimerase